MFGMPMGGSPAKLPAGVLLAALGAAIAAKTSSSKLVGMWPDPDVLIGGAILELHRAGTLVEALIDYYQHNLTCNARCGCRRYRNRDIGRA